MNCKVWPCRRVRALCSGAGGRCAVRGSHTQRHTHAQRATRPAPPTCQAAHDLLDALRQASLAAPRAIARAHARKDAVQRGAHGLRARASGVTEGECARACACTRTNTRSAHAHAGTVCTRTPARTHKHAHMHAHTHTVCHTHTHTSLCWASSGGGAPAPCLAFALLHTAGLHAWGHHNQRTEHTPAQPQHAPRVQAHAHTQPRRAVPARACAACMQRPGPQAQPWPAPPCRVRAPMPLLATCNAHMPCTHIRTCAQHGPAGPPAPPAPPHQGPGRCCWRPHPLTHPPPPAPRPPLPPRPPRPPAPVHTTHERVGARVGAGTRLPGAAGSGPCEPHGTAGGAPGLCCACLMPKATPPQTYWRGLRGGTAQGQAIEARTGQHPPHTHLIIRTQAVQGNGSARGLPQGRPLVVAAAAAR